MRFLVILTVVGCVMMAAAQDFQLQTSDGKLAGPFRFREGETLQLGTNIASVVNIRSQENEILDAMQAIRIPEIDFRQADLRDVITFLHEASVQFSPDRRGISFSLKQDDPPGDGPDPAIPPEAISYAPTVTFSALDITLKEALEVVVEITGYKYRMLAGVVMVLPRNAPDGPIVIRTYDIMPTAICRLQEIGSTLRHDQPDAYEDDDNLKTYFSDLGVSWPTGSSIKFMRAIGKLSVANTEENLQTFERCLAKLNVWPYQIEIELVFLSCDRRQISDLGPDGVSVASLTALWTNGDAELLAAPRVLTQSGQPTTIKGVTACVYPTDYKVCGTGCATNTNSTATAFMVEPRDFKTRELGASLKAVSEVSPDGNLIDVSIEPEFVEAPVWEQFGGTFMDADGKTQQTNMPQPQFHLYNGKLTVLATNGNRLLLGGGIPSRDGQRLVYMLLTVRLVSPEGEPLQR